MNDPINPAHYNSHPSGVECIDITEHMNFCLGNAIKYAWRAGLKTDDPIEDLRKAAWYIDREINRLLTKKINDDHARTRAAQAENTREIMWGYCQSERYEITPEEDDAWKEKRMDCIGQNGNGGEHYGGT